ncbi:MAG: hypothetical protein Salg2KO_05380 [Salibacteraceae bacterium]
MSIYGQHAYAKVSFNSRPTVTEIVKLIAKDKPLDLSLNEKHVQRTLDGWHIQYQIEWNGYPVYNGLAFLHVMTNGGATLRYPVYDITEFTQVEIAPFSRPKPTAPDSFENVWKNEIEWCLINGDYALMQIVKGYWGYRPVEVRYTLDRVLVDFRDLGTFKERDSTGIGGVFLPDPLTSSASEYGVIFSDLNDQNTSLFEEQERNVSFPIRWSSNDAAWVLESDHCIGIDTIQPQTELPKSVTGRFEFHRNEGEFEYVNTHYHINQYRLYLDSIGFDSMANYQIRYDAHATEFDQSLFSPSSETQGWLRFGDGGVDDAEDADVIIHEYGHALSHSASPGTRVGTERESLDEAFCDYVAYTYSRAISDVQQTRIFNWDGHNEFWDGRNINDMRTYPSELVDDRHLDAPVFSSAMADIYNSLGREKTDKLYLTSIYSYFPYMTMSDAADLIIQTDSILFEGRHRADLELVFCIRGLLKSCHDTLPLTTPLAEPYLGNSMGFAYKQQPLIIYPNGYSLIDAKLYDLSGNLLQYIEFDGEQRLYEELEFISTKPGLYVLVLNTSSGPYNFKLLRL